MSDDQSQTAASTRLEKAEEAMGLVRQAFAAGALEDCITCIKLADSYFQLASLDEKIQAAVSRLNPGGVWTYATKEGWPSIVVRRALVDATNAGYVESGDANGVDCWRLTDEGKVAQFRSAGVVRKGIQ